jgi:DNA-directed RNA polymerase subunit M/transcription elongation factor TFIIS
MSPTTPPDQIDNATEDILFECPQCGKSLEIDARGAGYIIVCPDCKHEIQVPAWNTAESESHEDEGDDDTRQRVKIEEMLQQLQVKISQLEKQQKADEHCFKRLGDEIVLIQAALDRITEIVESRNAEG